MLLLFSGKRLHSNVLSVHCEQELVGYASLLIGYGFWGDLLHDTCIGYNVLLVFFVPGKRLHSNVLSVHCEQDLVGYASLLIGYGIWGDLIHHAETRRGLKKLRYLCEFYK